MEAYRAAIHERSKRSKDRRVKAKLKTLDDLEDWRLNELPKIVESRKPPYMNGKELSQLVQLKLLRGKFRPRLQNLCDSNSEALVQKATKESFKALSQNITSETLTQAIQQVTVLKGIGPATASLILCTIYDIPFMSDPAYTHAFGPGKIDYTVKKCVELFEKWQQLAEEAGCSCRDLELRVWTDSELADRKQH